MTVDELKKAMDRIDFLYKTCSDYDDILKTANSRDRKIIENEQVRLEIEAKKLACKVDTELYKRHLSWWEV